MFASKDELFTRPSGGYNIARSVRLRSSASAYFNRTPAGASNQKTFTYSAWIKRGDLTIANRILIQPNVSFEAIYFDNATNALRVQSITGTTYDLRTTQLFRDPSAWYHIVVAFDTTQATSTNRIKIYVNGLQVTAFDISTYPTQNGNTAYNSAIAQYIGGTQYFDGYLTEVNFIDGQALTPSSFGSTNAITGVWQPAKYTGTYGTNGFYLNFSDNSNNTATTIGKDYSGNGNNWTPNNISVTAGVTYDSMTDVPTLTSATAANYAVYNPLAKGANVTISDGNLKYSSNASSGTNGFISMYISTGMKSYFEFTCGSAATYRNVDFGPAGVTYAGDTGVISGGTGGSGTFATWTNGDVIAFACDYSAATIACYKNGTLQTTITGATNTSSWSINASQAVGLGEFYFNAGQRPFSYTPPTGFVALNTYNLPASTITNGAAYMAATTYTGNSSTQTVSNAVNGVSMQPDWVWIKNRSTASQHVLTDSVRGIDRQLFSSLTNAEQTSATAITALNSNGFTTGANPSPTGSTNSSPDAFVAWQWKAGGTSASNTNGSITSTVSAGATQGFSVVTYTGNGVNATVGHGLGVAPSMIVIKARVTAYNWVVWHTSLGGGDNALQLNTTIAVTSAFDYWNGANTSSVFTLGTDFGVNKSAETYVAYCFSAVAGYSAFGSYTGNGSADGTFVYLGFRPRFLMIRGTAASDWWMYDTSRSASNTANLVLYADTSAAEISDSNVDILSNGFKLRSATYQPNTSGATFIYMAFAENPFRNSLAR